MLSWGEIWDQREELAFRVTFSITPEELALEKAKVQKLIETSSLDDFYELEVRLQALSLGLVATPEQIKEGIKILDEEFFPDLASSTSSLTAAGNECHDERGRFCEVHGTIHNPKKGLAARFIEGFAEAKANASRPPVQLPKASPATSPAKPTTPAPTTAMVPQKVTLPGGGLGKMFGGSPKLASQKQIDDEMKKIKTLAENADKGLLRGGGGRKGLHDKVEASVRSTALVAGRIASDSEVEKAYSEHQRRVASGMLVGGLIVHHFIKK